MKTLWAVFSTTRVGLGSIENPTQVTQISPRRFPAQAAVPGAGPTESEEKGHGDEWSVKGTAEFGLWCDRSFAKPGSFSKLGTPPGGWFPFGAPLRAIQQGLLCFETDSAKGLWTFRLLGRRKQMSDVLGQATEESLSSLFWLCLEGEV